MTRRRIAIEVAAAIVIAAVCLLLIRAILEAALPVPVWPAS